MKKGLLVFASLALASCIAVEDPGVYWDKAGVDAELVGKWKPLTLQEDEVKVDEVRIIDKSKDIVVEEYMGGKKVDDSKSNVDNQQSPLRTLQVGPHRFILEKSTKDPSMVMFRYTISQNKLTVYNDIPETIQVFLKKNFPQAKDIVVKSYGESLNEGDESGEKYTQIIHFTDDVFRILSQIPEDESYWKESSKYEKLP